MGAWIEIKATKGGGKVSDTVAPYMGAWIEIQATNRVDIQEAWSHPTWVRGLKFPYNLGRF